MGLVGINHPVANSSFLFGTNSDLVHGGFDDFINDFDIKRSVLASQSLGYTAERRSQLIGKLESEMYELIDVLKIMVGEYQNLYDALKNQGGAGEDFLKNVLTASELKMEIEFQAKVLDLKNQMIEDMTKQDSEVEKMLKEAKEFPYEEEDIERIALYLGLNEDDLYKALRSEGDLLDDLKKRFPLLDEMLKRSRDFSLNERNLIK